MKEPTFDQLWMTGARASAIKTGVGPRVSFPRFYRVKGTNCLRVKFEGKVYSVSARTQSYEEALKRRIELLLNAVRKPA
jgi:hypothetical protein